MRDHRWYPLGIFVVLVSLVASGAGAAPGARIALASIQSAGAAFEELASARSPARAAAAALLALQPRLPAPAAPGSRGFPALYDPRVAAREAASAAPRAADPEGTSSRSAILPVLANNQILAFYGKPGSKWMGILGEYPKEELVRLLKGYAKLYDEENGEAGVVPALYIIYGTCWPEGEIGYLQDSVLREYIELASREGMLVFVDHQIGKYPVEDAVRRLLPYLRYPNVHLALDPEWRTTAPMQEIGSVGAEEINAAQRMISDYLRAESLPGTKMLVVHQFKEKMIEGRSRVRADYERVALVHTADGFGPPALKRASYANNARASNMPIKGFKLFFKTEVPGAGFDAPLLTPPEVLALDPRPSLVIYQ